jgi:hypothetical protein
MSEQRIDTAAEAATGADADPGEGQGLASQAAHPGGFHSGNRGIAGQGEGDYGEVQLTDPDAPPSQDSEGGTEGARYIERVHQDASSDKPLEESGHAD